mgnify:CR=1 FL=1|jgi:hypothetical protein
MTREGKQEQRRHVCPRKRKNPSIKTGPKKDKLEKGYKEHTNVSSEDLTFISKIK